MTTADKATCTDAFKNVVWLIRAQLVPARLGRKTWAHGGDQLYNKNQMDTQGIPPTADDNLAAEITEHIQLKGASAIAKRTPLTADDNLAAEITEQN